MLFIKLSIGFLFLRILTASIQRKLCIGTTVLSTLVNAEYCIYMIYSVSICIGHDRLDGGFVGEIKGCRNMDVADIVQLYVQSVANVVFDIVLMVLPLPPLLSSSLHWKTKLSGTVLVVLAGV
jgi:hypothetical protein